MAGLLDFLQAASNAAASNVSGPVDAINWLLSKAGVPVSQSPVGGSQWMEQKGLTRKVPQGAASVLGETAGLLAPFAVAAKAPQIAGGLNQMVANAQTPATMNAQRGAIVWHGSPHKFDRFDSSKIGTGEGAQAYGHGLYLAESPQVAQGYKETLSAGRGAADDDVIARVLEVTGGDPAKAAAELRKRAQYANIPGGKERLAAMADRVATGFDPRGSLYKVDLPDEQIAKMLDWDKPLSQQAPEVLEWAKREDIRALHQMTNKGLGQATGADLYRNITATLNQKKTGELPSQMFQNNRLAGASDASDALKQLGIPGIRYLDGGSRGAGAGTSNYVVFPGGEDYLTILERNGISVR